MNLFYIDIVLNLYININHKSFPFFLIYKTKIHDSKLLRGGLTIPSPRQLFPSFLSPQDHLLHVLLPTEQTWTRVAPDAPSRWSSNPISKSFSKDISMIFKKPNRHFQDV